MFEVLTGILAFGLLMSGFVLLTVSRPKILGYASAPVAFATRALWWISALVCSSAVLVAITGVHQLHADRVYFLFATLALAMLVAISVAINIGTLRCYLRSEKHV